MLENEAFVLSELSVESLSEKDCHSPSGSMKIPLVKVRQSRGNVICSDSNDVQKSIAESVEKNLCRRVRLGQVSGFKNTSFLILSCCFKAQLELESKCFCLCGLVLWCIFGYWRPEQNDLRFLQLWQLFFGKNSYSVWPELFFKIVSCLERFDTRNW